VAGRAKGRSAGQMVGGAVAALILVGGGIYAWFDFSHASKKEAARAAEWDIAGPPCPEMTAADFAKTPATGSATTSLTKACSSGWLRGTPTAT